MGQTLIEIVKQAARLLLIELFVPGGTLIVISILLASRVPTLSNRFNLHLPILAAAKRPRHQDDLVVYWGLRSFR
jgi:hypothetical protein